MIRLSDNNIIVNSDMANTTVVIIFNNEELILTEISIKQFNHTIREFDSIDNNKYWSVFYHVDDDYFNINLTRKVLIEKIRRKYCWMYGKYNFYEPIEIIGKGNEVFGYEELFSIIEKSGGTFIPEKTLILKRK